MPAICAIILCGLAMVATPARANPYVPLVTGDWERANFDGKLPYRIFGKNLQAGRRYPLVVYLHGIHVCGSDNDKQLTGEAKSFSFARNYQQRPCIIIAPQCTVLSPWTKKSGDRVIQLIGELKKHLPVDPDRIYLSGYSLGGFGTWSLLAKQPKLFAAAIPIAGGGDPEKVATLKQVPIWAFHGAKDPIVKAIKSQEMVNSLKKSAGRIKYTEFPDAGHLITKRIFLEQKVHRWLFQQKRTR